MSAANKRNAVTVTIGLVAMLVLLAWQQQTITKTREALDAAELQLSDLRRENEKLSMAGPPAQPPGVSENERRELLRLRRQVAQLRQEKKESANTKPAAPALTSATPEGITRIKINFGGENPIALKESWKPAGYDLPEATVETIHCALREGDIQTLLESSTPLARKQLEENWAGKSEAEIKAALAELAKKIDGYRYHGVFPSPFGDDMLSFGLSRQGSGNVDLTLERIDGQWKCRTPLAAIGATAGILPARRH